MKKRIVFLLAALLCIFAAGSALAQEEHAHSWVWFYNNESHWRVCTECNEESVPAPHTSCACVGEPTDVCGRCGALAAEGARIQRVSHAEELVITPTEHHTYCAACQTLLAIGPHMGSCKFPDVCYYCQAKAADGCIISADEVAHVFDYEAGPESYAHDKETHWLCCAYCGQPDAPSLHCASCANPGVCKTCGVKAKDGYSLYVDHEYDWNNPLYDAQGHWYLCVGCGAESFHWAHVASCADNPDGKCDDCPASIKRGDDVNVAHEWDWDNPGYDKTQHWFLCLSCGKKSESWPHVGDCASGDPYQCVECPANGKDGCEVSVSHAYDLEHPLAQQDGHYYLCQDCGEKSEVFEHWARCTDKNKDKCHECGAKKKDGCVITVSHNYDYSQPAYTIEGHQYVCADCGEKSPLWDHYASCTDADPGQCSLCPANAKDGYEVYVTHNESVDWDHLEYDKTYHWYTCRACGQAVYKRMHGAECTSSDPNQCSLCPANAKNGCVILAEHDFDWEHPVYDTQSHWALCNNCDTESEHEPHAALCTEKDRTRCRDCGATAKAGYVIGVLHEEADLKTWKYDEKQHWNPCACGEKVNAAVHQFNGKNVCAVCGCQKSGEPSGGKAALSQVRYDGQVLSGKLTPTGQTALSAQAQVRVTFYLEGNIYMGTYGEIEANGEFSVDAVGLIRYITVIALEGDTRLDAMELYN